MKCGIITFHRAINYGGALQALALQRTVEKLNVDAELIDYYAPSIEGLYRPSLKQRFSYINIKRTASALLRNGTLSFNNEGFAAFRKKYMKESANKYYNSEDLGKSDYDVYITGSDQVWSPTCAGFDKNYFLDFVKDGKKKNSYAASFGVGDIPDNLTDEYRSLLCDYNKISVREADGAAIIKKVLDKDVPTVLDPTLLLTKDEWKSYADESAYRNEKYILLYMIAEDEELIGKALSLAKKTGFKVYYVNDRFYKAKGVNNLRKVSPDKWIGLFMNAEYVFTNSFHGVAFSINFEKKFHVQMLKANVKVNSRINNILELLQLEHRGEFELAEQEIDYKTVNTILDKEREKSLAYLTGIFQGENQW